MSTKPDKPSTVSEAERMEDIQILYDVALGEPDQDIQAAAVRKLNAVAGCITVNTGCFVPRPVDGYYLKMFIIADLAAKGYPYAAI